jgi:hypothetical protein
MDKSPLIQAVEDLRDLVNTDVPDPRTRAMLLRYLEDFEDKLLGCLRRDADRQRAEHDNEMEIRSRE